MALTGSLRMKDLIRLLEKKERRILGVMSGTSLDGVDLAYVRLKGTGPGAELELIEFDTVPMPTSVRDLIQGGFQASTRELCQINFDLGNFFADTLSGFCAEKRIKETELDAVGFHGQTLYHIHRRSTLQSGEADIIAQRLNTVVVSDFRSADIAAGGSGAPLVPYLDRLLFHDRKENTVLLNLGGIANLTYLPKIPGSPVVAFDTGPANAVLNELVTIISGGTDSCDRDAVYSQQGKTDPELLEKLLKDGYFTRPLPKSTGRETYGAAFVKSLLADHPGLPREDLLRTLVSLIATSIQDACETYLGAIDKIWVSGGGVHHPLLMNELRERFGQSRISPFKEIKGITVDSKEAVAFALLAHERLNGTPSNVPEVTGAERPVCLGKLSIP